MFSALGSGPYSFTPVLQRADGSYIGTDSGQNYVMAMAPAGGLLWQQQVGSPSQPVPARPLYATSDGGVVFTTSPKDCAPGDIGAYVASIYCQSNSGLTLTEPEYAGLLPTDSSYGQLGTLYTLDQNGNIASQSPDTGAAPSWTNQWYTSSTGAISAVSNPPAEIASSWAAIKGGNHSGSGASVQQQWYPPLPSCNDPGSSLTCPGPRESAVSALNALRSLVSNACLNCAAYVFQPLGNIDDQTAFARFLGHNPGLFDGTRSNMPLSNICKLGSWDGIQCSLGLWLNGPANETISQFFSSTPGLMALSQMPAPHGLRIFFSPSSICSVYADQTSGIFNQSQLFHESLHGFYGDSDARIQKAFGLAQEPSNTINITFYIQQNVFGRAASICGN